MTEYGRILVGVDGSDTAAVAAERAIDLAARYGAELHVVDVVPVPTVGAALGAAGASAIAARVEKGDRQASAALEATLRRAQDRGVSATSHLVHGDPAPSILSTAASVNADVIVVGNRGIDASGRYALGSVPESVLFGAECDVVVVRSAAPR